MMLTPKQEDFCKYIEIEKLSQYEAYMRAYPAARNWKRESVDVQASILAKDNKILLRRKELRDEQTEDIKKAAKWTRDDACKKLSWLIEKAEEMTEQKGEITKPAISAMLGAIKELNAIYAVSDKAEGKGVLEDILKAVRDI